jgi:uncharacterized membrane protein HdeD (DUF308 family)
LIRKVFKLNFAQHLNTTDWVQLLVEGVAALIAGIALILWPGSSSAFLVNILGLFAGLYGLSMLLSLITDRTEWGWRVAGGVGCMALGGVILAFPTQMVRTVSVLLVWLLGTLGIVNGVIYIIRGFGNSTWKYVVVGFASLIVGFGLIIGIFLTAFAAPWLIGAFLLLVGVVSFVAALRKRRAPAPVPVIEAAKPAPQKAVAGKR